MGHWVLLRKGKGDVVIFARAYHDFLYQRAYLNLPEAIPRLFLMLGPKPDLVASPLRSPQAIHAQKPELSVEEIEEQYARILDRFMRFCYFRGIDASQGITLTVQGIRSLLKL